MSETKTISVRITEDKAQAVILFADAIDAFNDADEDSSEYFDGGIEIC